MSSAVAQANAVIRLGAWLLPPHGAVVSYSSVRGDVCLAKIIGTVFFKGHGAVGRLAMRDDGEHGVLLGDEEILVQELPPRAPPIEEWPATNKLLVLELLLHKLYSGTYTRLAHAQ